MMNIQVLQVFPAENYRVYVYFSNGKVKLYDVSALKEKGVFRKLQDRDFYYNRCTVLNGTLAWDVSGDFDPYQCIDIDPYMLYEDSVDVPDPLSEPA